MPFVFPMNRAGATSISLPSNIITNFVVAERFVFAFFDTFGAILPHTKTFFFICKCFYNLISIYSSNQQTLCRNTVLDEIMAWRYDIFIINTIAGISFFFSFFVYCLPFVVL